MKKQKQRGLKKIRRKRENVQEGESEREVEKGEKIRKRERRESVCVCERGRERKR